MHHFKKHKPIADSEPINSLGLKEKALPSAFGT
jgi:hypothetical protein